MNSGLEVSLEDYGRDAGMHAGMHRRRDPDVFITSAQLPVPPRCLRSSNLGALAGVSQHDGSAVTDRIHLYGQRDTFCSLGWLVLAGVLHDISGEIEISLANEVDVDSLARNGSSESRLVRTIVIGFEELTRRRPGCLSVEPMGFSYWPSAPSLHPWSSNLPSDPTSLPVVYRADRQGSAVSHIRDVLFGFGTARGSVRVAELLLNMKYGEDQHDDHVLEDERGFRGVGPGSSELALHTPGSTHWRAWHETLNLPGPDS